MNQVNFRAADRLLIPVTLYKWIEKGSDSRGAIDATVEHFSDPDWTLP